MAEFLCLTQFRFFYSLYGLILSKRKVPHRLDWSTSQEQDQVVLGGKKRKRVIDVWIVRMDGIDADSGHCLDHFRRRQDSAIR